MCQIQTKVLQYLKTFVDAKIDLQTQRPNTRFRYQGMPVDLTY